MNSASLHGIVSEMNQQALQISGLKSPFATVMPSAETDAPSFSDVLMKSIGELNNQQVASKQKSEDFLSGQSDISLNDAMISLQKSSVSLNLGVQVRNKLVSAYQDIMSMSV